MIANRSSHPVVHNISQSRFEVQSDGHLAFASYIREGDLVVFDHTYVSDTLRGQGLAAYVVRAALEEAQRRHWKTIARCPYVAGFIARNPEFADLVDWSSQKSP